jgi:hypothetical protein
MIWNVLKMSFFMKKQIAPLHNNIMQCTFLGHKDQTKLKVDL